MADDKHAPLPGDPPNLLREKKYRRDHAGQLLAEFRVILREEVRRAKVYAHPDDIATAVRVIMSDEGIKLYGRDY